MINTTPLVLSQQSTAVYHVGEQPPGTEPLPKDGEIGSISGGRFVVGFFEGDANLLRFVIVNADYAKPAAAELRFRRRINVAKAWDHHIALWGKLQHEDLEEGSALRINLDPGDGRIVLVQLKQPS